MVTVLVGKGREKHIVHEQVLCERSPFFAAAFDKEWKEGQERTIPLPDDDPEAFALYLQWIYRGKIFSRRPPCESPFRSGKLDLLIDCYIFGEKVQDDGYKDAVLDSLLACTSTKDEERERWFPTGQSVQRAYQKTPSGWPLRKLLVDMHNRSGRADWIKEEGKSVQFLADLTREMFATQPGPVGLDSKDEQCYSR